MYRILIIETTDDCKCAGGAFKNMGIMRVHCVTNFKNGDGRFPGSMSPQLVLLDIVLPLFNGFHWCQEIRKISKVPIIFLSSANDNMNIVMAMNMGGDEFVEKPFDLSVVTAKVQAVLRRAYAFRGTMDVLEHAGVMLNVNDATVTCGSQSVELTKNEFRILKLLMENSGRIVSRENLITRLWESDEFIDDNTLTVNVARLRKNWKNRSRKLDSDEERNWVYCGMIKLLGSFLKEKEAISACILDSLVCFMSFSA